MGVMVGNDGYDGYENHQHWNWVKSMGIPKAGLVPQMDSFFLGLNFLTHLHIMRTLPATM